ncbi:uncharacterized protein LOC109138735 [Larimichthys crocea]|uniref:uncharacterized protein LOC109138735 n=1 Tax=Larimichthys crocea TaxID=215358 RepID=UPI000F603449|nr:uncharacterized protein LOC109138735 [Larimichthys crocea]
MHGPSCSGSGESYFRLRPFGEIVPNFFIHSLSARALCVLFQFGSLWRTVARTDDHPWETKWLTRGGGIQEVDRRGAGGGFQLDGRVMIIQGCQGRCLPLRHENVCVCRPTLWASRAESQKEHSTLRAPCGFWGGDKKVWASGSGYPPELQFLRDSDWLWVRTDGNGFQSLLIAGSGVVGCAIARLGRSFSSWLEWPGWEG